MMNLACGSIQYAAPEILRRQRYMGEKVDIWSVGIMLFGLVNSYLPFEDDGQGLSSVLRKIQLNDYQFKEGLSPEIKDLLTRMLTVTIFQKF
jgi:serine/threonine protein kinase